MNLFLYLVIGLSAGWLTAHYTGVQELWMQGLYMGVGVLAAMVAGALLNLVVDLLKTLFLLVLAAGLVILALNLIHPS